MTFGETTATLKKTKVELLEERKHSGSKFKELEDQYNNWLKYEEKLRTLKSRELWLLERDKNTEFFHQRTNYRHKWNGLEWIRNKQGKWVSDPNQIVEALKHQILKISGDDEDFN
uniref:Uncharacterized protein n=1 Tax=Nelumbo nucifera TaxID=4432 RepID=A0A822XAD5_NELNU|nr:TPA_asm: hypothetical protein HUJ06_019867 [Nelumbo nucifera]